ncbi:MAG: hypothetical protein WC932_04930 [archaeon]|jgi:hypothetical protein
MKKLLAALIITLIVAPVYAKMYRYVSLIEPLQVQDSCYYAIYIDYSRVREAIPTLKLYLPYYRTERSAETMDPIGSNHMNLVFCKRWFLTNVMWIAIHGQAQEVYVGRNLTATELQEKNKLVGGVISSIDQLRSLREQCLGRGREQVLRCVVADVTPLLIDQMNKKLFMDESYFWIGENVFFHPGACGKYFSLPENPDAIPSMSSGWQTSQVIRNVSNDHIFGLYRTDWINN